MIELIHVKNFKSLSDVSLKLEKFNCLIGMNGAGKSTILQVLDFLSQMMIGQVQDWLDSRGWKSHDLNCKLGKESNLLFCVKYKTSTGQALFWFATFNRVNLRCTREEIFVDGLKIFIASGQLFQFRDKPKQDISFVFQGSLLSVLKDSELPEPVKEFRDALRKIRSLELLSPQMMRKRARSNDQDIGAGGEKLSAFLYSIKGGHRDRLLNMLKDFYPNLLDFKVTSQKAGWKKLSVIEKFRDQKLETEATHLNDGLLRILAVLAQSESDRSLILLDEIENGINQELVEKLVDKLVASQQQMLITTHSPLILNYLDDETARKSVQFIYKTPQGLSKIRRFFEITRVGEKLRYMGPGDAFVDTDLKALTEECIELDIRSPVAESLNMWHLRRNKIDLDACGY
jgi:predicted ATPase